MTNLIERLEAADGADRLLDANIHWRVRRDDFESDDEHTDETYCYARSGWTMNRADHAFLDSIPVPRYTASIDAALTPAPEWAHVQVLLDAINSNCEASDWLKHLPRYVVAAALRAQEVERG